MDPLPERPAFVARLEETVAQYDEIGNSKIVRNEDTLATEVFVVLRGACVGTDLSTKLRPWSGPEAIELALMAVGLRSRLQKKLWPSVGLLRAQLTRLRVALVGKLRRGIERRRHSCSAAFVSESTSMGL